ncbi:MAG TPA: hypothetical protein PKA55_17240 [Rhodoblastus sp.]|nr:hypothetical protein [Rhodoblastus sp.]
MRATFVSQAAIAALLLSAPAAMAQEKGMRGGESAPAAPAPPPKSGAQMGEPARPPNAPRAGAAEKSPPKADGRNLAEPGSEPKAGEARPQTKPDMKKAEPAGEKGEERRGKNASDAAQPPGGPATAQQPAAGEHRGAASVSASQKTELRGAVAHVKAREVANVNIRVSIGARAPRTIVEYWEPAPPEIVAIMPAWSGYKIVRYHGQLLIIDPVTLEIVYVLAA